MNGTTFNNTTQPLDIPQTLIQPFIPGKQVTFKTPEEQAVRHYNKLIITIMKVIDIQYITHYMDNQYRLITIHRADNTLIHIKPSKTLTKHLLKQKDKLKSIKIGVHSIKQAMILSNGIYYHMTSNSMNK